MPIVLDIVSFFLKVAILALLAGAMLGAAVIISRKEKDHE